jgi:hypothetical protein
MGLADAAQHEILGFDWLRHASTVRSHSSRCSLCLCHSYWHCSLRLIPIAIVRLKSLNISLTSEEYFWDSATTEYHTQVEMTFSLIAATIPCLRMFMEAANTGLLGISMWDAETTTGTGSYTRSRTGKRTGDTLSRRREDPEGIRLRDMSGGSNTVHVRTHCLIAWDLTNKR